MKKNLWVFLTLIIIVFFAFGCSKQEVQVTEKQKQINNKDFIIAGSGSNLPITGKIIELYNINSKVKIQMPKSIGSGGGIKAVYEGAIALGLSSRPLKEEELRDGLKQLPYARIGVVLGSNLDVPDNNISYDDLVKIYQGKVTKWKNGNRIIVLTREASDSSNKVLAKEVPGFKEVLKASEKSERWQVYFTDLEMSKAITKTSSSIGLTDTGAITASKLMIKPLKINGVEATIDNVKNGSYKLYKDLYFVYKEPLSEQAKKFLDFVYSKEGQRIITSNGGIPLKR